MLMDDVEGLSSGRRVVNNHWLLQALQEAESENDRMTVTGSF